MSADPVAQERTATEPEITQVTRLRVIARRLACGIIPRSAAQDVETCADEMDKLLASRDALAHHADELDAQIAALQIRLTPPVDLTGFFEEISDAR